MKQIARNWTTAGGDFLNGSRYILMDRDANVGEAFRTGLLTPSRPCE